MIIVTGERDGDGRFGMIKHIEERAVNEETKVSQGHNSRWETGDGDQSRKMTGYGGDFTRTSTSKNDQRYEVNLKGGACKVVESLEYTAVAHEAAKERLERKYGGKCRQITINMEEIDQFKPI